MRALRIDRCGIEYCTHRTVFSDAGLIECEIGDIQRQRAATEKPEGTQENLLAIVILQTSVKSRAHAKRRFLPRYSDYEYDHRQ